MSPRRTITAAGAALLAMTTGLFFAPRAARAVELAAVLVFDAGGVDAARKRLGAGTFVVIVDVTAAGAILSGPIPLELVREAGYEARVTLGDAAAAPRRVGLAITDRAGRELFHAEAAPVAAGLTPLRTGGAAALGSGVAIEGLALLVRSIEAALAGNLPETDAFRARFASAVKAIPDSAYRREIVDGLIRRKYDLTPQRDPAAGLHDDTPAVH